MRHRKINIAAVLAVVLFIIAAAAGCLFYTASVRAEFLTDTVAELTSEKERYSKTAYVAIADIRAGEELIENVNVECRQVYSAVDSWTFWYPSGTPAVATVDIHCDSPVFDSMVSGSIPLPDSRTYEISAVNLMTAQRDYDYIDIRITYPDGSDYVVLSKKQIYDLSLETCVFNVTATEREIQLMTSAILDAYLIDGTRLYATTYVEGSLQEAAVSTYPVKSSTLELLRSKNNSNLSETLSTAVLELNRLARADLESRLGNVTDEQASRADSAWSDMRGVSIPQSEEDSDNYYYY